MTLTTHDIGVARQIGRYGDSVEVSGNVRWLYTSGTPGLGLDGTLPSDIAGQARSLGSTLSTCWPMPG